MNFIKRNLANFILLGFSLLFSVAIGEIMVRMFNPQSFEAQPRGMYVEDPYAGYKMAHSYSAMLERPEYATPFSTNSFGLRGSDDIPQRVDNTVRIVLLGDSMSWGFGVEDDETYAVHLEEMLQNEYADLDIQVINAAMPGYGTVDQLNYFNAYGKDLDPDIVLVQFFSINDLYDNQTPAIEWAIVIDEMLHDKDNVASPKRVLPPIERIKQWLKQNSQLASLVSDTIGYLATRAGILGQVDSLWGEDFDEEVAQLGIDLLHELAQSAAQLDAETVFLYTTGQAQVIEPEYILPKSSRIVSEAAEISDVPWIDVAAELSQRSDRYDLYYQQDGHWTPAGHKAVAEVTGNNLIDLDVILLEGR